MPRTRSCPPPPLRPRAMAEDKRGATFVLKAEPDDRSAQPPINFNTFLLGLASTTLIHLGESSHPEGGKPERNLVLARQSLDLLSLIREKTRGNLTAEEERFFENVLADLRFRFIEASKHLARARAGARCRFESGMERWLACCYPPASVSSRQAKRSTSLRSRSSEKAPYSGFQRSRTAPRSSG